MNDESVSEETIAFIFHLFSLSFRKCLSFSSMKKKGYRGHQPSPGSILFANKPGEGPTITSLDSFDRIYELNKLAIKCALQERIKRQMPWAMPGLTTLSFFHKGKKGKERELCPANSIHTASIFFF